MKIELIDQSHEILFITHNALQLIERIGRVCYKSEDKLTDTSFLGFTKMLRNRKHTAMTEFGDITVKFITNRGVTHELVRHRLCSFAQESTRYVNYGNKGFQFILPVWMDKKFLGSYDSANALCFNGPDGVFMGSLACAAMAYDDLLTRGWKPEQAREVLPNALKTEIVMKANITEWRHVFSLRTSRAAHPQMVALMRPLLKELRVKVPVLFDDVGVLSDDD